MSHRLIDVSEHQRDVDWGRVRAAGFAGAIVRVADGDHRDPFYTERRVRALERAGLTWGPYYYARVASAGNGERSGAQEAEMAVGFARQHGWGKKGHLRFAYDFEEANGQPPRKAAKHAVAFVRACERLTAELPIFYTMPGFWQQLAGQLDEEERRLIGRCPLWIAHWRVARPTVPRPWDHYVLWQHDDHGEVPGVSTPADMNRTHGGLGELKVGGRAPPTTLRKGDRGAPVERLQRRLRSLAAADATLDPGPADGFFGARTERAVKVFQRRARLEADGVVGRRTWQALDS